ncbi:cytochrome P450 monooxygenase CYP539B5 [Xylariomycetidae sp. FL0641]|nr:cytochrome P450 monooxygenase CYP539B5 [Xylariomycetidae sp. FL0641]
MLAQSTGSEMAILPLILIVCFSAVWVVQRFRHDLRIRKIGGVRAPVVAGNPLTGLYWFILAAKAQRRNRLLDYYEELLSHGTSDAQFHELWRPFLGDSIFTTDRTLWHDSRSIIRPMFVKDRVSDLATFERWVSTLIDKLPPSGQTVDIMDLFYRMTLDVTTDFLLGASVDSLTNPKSEFATAFNEVQNIQMMITTAGPFQALVPRRRYRAGIREIDRFVMPYIERALALPPAAELEKAAAAASSSSSSDHSDHSDRGAEDLTFLHRVARHTRDDRAALRDQLVAVLLAGRDTTAATLARAFYELAAGGGGRRRGSPACARRGPGRRGPEPPPPQPTRTCRPCATSATPSARPSAVPYNLRTALADTTLPGDPPVAVVAGDVVVYSALAMQRRPDLYPQGGGGGGFADPAVFAPERWETWTPRPWHYVPFNGGPRICVGQNFAMTEMAYCMVRILQKYDRLEYRGDWHAQKHVAEIVGKPCDGVKVALYEAKVPNE